MADIYDKRGAYALASVDPIWPARDGDIVLISVHGEALQVFKSDFDEAVKDLYRVTVRTTYEKREQQ